MNYVVWLIVFFTYYFSSFAQSITVENIEITGNKRTRNYVILREMTFVEGDTLSKTTISEVFKRNQQNIYNLGLFNSVVVTPTWKEDSTSLTLEIQVKERWYIFPAASAVVEERNSRDVLEKLLYQDTRLSVLNRLSVNGSLFWTNITGRNETLWFLAQLGFSKQFYLYYGLPWFIPKQRIDASVGLKYIEQKEMITNTLDGKVRWGRVTTEPLKTTIGGYVNFRKRFDAFQSLSMKLSYSYFRIADSMKYYNPVYIGNNNQIEHYPSLQLEYVNDVRDVKAYPSKGFRFRAMERVYGFLPYSTSNFTKAAVTWAHYIPLSKRWNFAYGSENIWILGRKVPYFEKVFVWLETDDFGDFAPQIRGYQTYSISGSLMT
ncbi:MAG: POTRA domain-containing protein, partial [Bacteroidia bacterium]